MNFTEEALKQALMQADDDWNEQIDMQYGALPEHTFSHRFERNMKRLIRVERRTPVVHRLISFSQRAAAVFLVLLLGITVTTISMEGYRERFLEVITKVTHKSTDYQFRLDTDEYFTADLTKTMYGYIPEGYEKVEENYLNAWESNIRFEKDDGSYFSISISLVDKKSAGVISVDTENSELYNITINGDDGILNIKNGYCTVLWGQKNAIVDIFGTIDSKDAIKIAENVEICFTGKEK